MRILLVGHTPWQPTGYGTPMIPICNAIQKAGHDVAIFGTEAGTGVMEYKGIPVFFCGTGDLYGRDRIKEIVTRWGADLVISILDAWAVGPIGYSETVSGVPWISWGPIEAHPMPNNQNEILQHASEIWTWSEYGYNLIQDEYPGLANKLRHVPLSVDTRNYRISTETERAEIRESFGVESHETLFVFSGTNKFIGDRKCVQQNARAFALYAQRFPNSKILFFTKPYGVVNLPALFYELEIMEQVLYVPNVVRDLEFASSEEMRKIYWSADCLLHASAAEGFGLQILEAMACGVPVIGADNSAMSELIKPGVNGELAKPMTKEWSSYGSWWERPDKDSIFVAMAKYTDTEYDKKETRATALRYTHPILNKNLKNVLSEVQDGWKIRV